EELQYVVEGIHDQTPDNLASELTKIRQKVWWNFTLDTFEHRSALADKLEARLHALLSSEIPINGDRSRWEVVVWQEVLDLRASLPRQRGTQKWWLATIRQLEDDWMNPSFLGPDLPALRAALQADYDHEVN